MQSSEFGGKAEKKCRCGHNSSSVVVCVAAGRSDFFLAGGRIFRVQGD